MAERALSEDPDHMFVVDDEIPWLIAQLACWPKRVDVNRTANMRFLMLSAAATLLARSRASSPDEEGNQ